MHEEYSTGSSASAEKKNQTTPGSQMADDTSRDTFAQTRRTMLKATGMIGGLSLTAVGSVAAQQTTTHFVEYAIYGDVDENSDKNYATAVTDHLPAHFPRGEGEMDVHRHRLRDEDEQLFESSSAVAWGTSYRSLPIRHTREDRYSLADATTVAKVNPVVSFREIGDRTPPPAVRLDRNGDTVEVSSQGNTITVGGGESKLLSLDSHSARVRTYQHTPAGDSPSKNESDEVSVTPKVFVHNHGTMRITWR